MKPTGIRRKAKELRSSSFLAWSLGVLILFLGACETDDPNEDPAANRDKYLGLWQVTENTGINHPQFYQVSIVAGDADDEIVIQGLYNEPNSKVAALIAGSQLTIPSQISEGVSYLGSGTANADFTQIALSFTADDGSGPDQVEAVLVP